MVRSESGGGGGKRLKLVVEKGGISIESELGVHLAVAKDLDFYMQRRGVRVHTASVGCGRIVRRYANDVVVVNDIL